MFIFIFLIIPLTVHFSILCVRQDSNLRRKKNFTRLKVWTGRPTTDTDAFAKKGRTRTYNGLLANSPPSHGGVFPLNYFLVQVWKDSNSHSSGLEADMLRNYTTHPLYLPIHFSTFFPIFF